MINPHTYAPSGLPYYTETPYTIMTGYWFLCNIRFMRFNNTIFYADNSPLLTTHAAGIIIIIINFISNLIASKLKLTAGILVALHIGCWNSAAVK